MGNTPKAILTRHNSEHKSAQTDTTEVRHVGIQFEPHQPRDEEETQRRNCNQNLQSQMNNLSVEDDQLAHCSTVLKNEGPAQLGEHNSIVNNPIYKITNHNYYHIHCQPSSHHGNNQPCHIPCQCQECIQSYVNQHMPLTDHPRQHPESESRRLGPPHHPVLQVLPSPQQTEQMKSTDSIGNDTTESETHCCSHSQQMEPQESIGNGTSRSETQHVSHSQHIESTESGGNDTSRTETQRGSHSQQMEPQESRGNGTSWTEKQRVSHSQQIESTKSRGNGTSRSKRGHVNHSQQMVSKEGRGKDQSKRPTEGQRSSPSRRLPHSDVIQHATRTERERAESETVNLEGGDSKKINQSQTTQNAGTRSPSMSVTHDTVSVIDSNGQVLEPGDALWTEGPGYWTTAIYVGHQMLVRCDWRNGNKMVKEEQLCMTARFAQLTVHRSRFPVYQPRERVDRATSKIERKFTEGDEESNGSDFPTWVFTGLGFNEAMEKGFVLY